MAFHIKTHTAFRFSTFNHTLYIKKKNGGTKIDFDKLAVSIIEAYESDREESGRSELAKGMEYVLDKYKSEHDREVISEVLMAFTGYSLDTLLKRQTKNLYAVDIEWDTSDMTDEEIAEVNLPEEVRLPAEIAGRLTAAGDDAVAVWLSDIYDFGVIGYRFARKN